MHSQLGWESPRGSPQLLGALVRAGGPGRLHASHGQKRPSLGKRVVCRLTRGLQGLSLGHPRRLRVGTHRQAPPAAHVAALKQPLRVARRVTARWPSAEGQLSPQKSSSRQTVKEQRPQCLLVSDGHRRPHPATHEEIHPAPTTTDRGPQQPRRTRPGREGNAAAT